MPPSYVKPYMKRRKTNAADAAAICDSRNASLDAVCRHQERSLLIGSGSSPHVRLSGSPTRADRQRDPRPHDGVRYHSGEGRTERRSIRGAPGSAAGNGPEAREPAFRSVRRDGYQVCRPKRQRIGLRRAHFWRTASIASASGSFPTAPSMI